MLLCCTTVEIFHVTLIIITQKNKDSETDKYECSRSLWSHPTMAPFASLKKQDKTLFRLICCERKTLFRLKKQAEKDGL